MAFSSGSDNHVIRSGAQPSASTAEEGSSFGLEGGAVSR